MVINLLFGHFGNFKYHVKFSLFFLSNYLFILLHGLLERIVRFHHRFTQAVFIRIWDRFKLLRLFNFIYIRVNIRWFVHIIIINNTTLTVLDFSWRFIAFQSLRRLYHIRWALKLLVQLTELEIDFTKICSTILNCDIIRIYTILRGGHLIVYI